MYVFTFQYGQIRKTRAITDATFTFEIYIPVWLDQKDRKQLYFIYVVKDLHSSMVRLESPFQNGLYANNTEFTFQYGQIRKITFTKTNTRQLEIYIPVWLDQKAGLW